MDFGDDKDFVTFDMGAYDNVNDFDFNAPTVPDVKLDVPKKPEQSKSPIPPPTIIAEVGHTQQPETSIATDTKQDEILPEPPLLEELGIDFSLIGKRIVSRLNPFGSNEAIESDVIGSLFFGLLLGISIALTGKFRFGYVFGFTIIGSIAEYIVLNLLSNKDVAYFCVLTNLGYSSYPLFLLAVSSLFVTFVNSPSNMSVIVIINMSRSDNSQSPPGI